MKRQLKRLWKEKRGSSPFYAVIMVLAILLLFAVISEYLRIQIITKGIRDSLQESVLAVSTENYANLYNGLREGYSGGYILKSGQWQDNFTEGDVMEYLKELLGLSKSGSRYVKMTGKNVEFSLSSLKIEVVNTPFAPYNAEQAERFEVTAYINVEIPYSLGFESLPPLKLTLKVLAGYTPKF